MNTSMKPAAGTLKTRLSITVYVNNPDICLEGNLLIEDEFKTA